MTLYQILLLLTLVCLSLLIVLLLFKATHRSNQWFRVNQAIFLCMLILMVLAGTAANDKTESFGKVLSESITSPQIMSIIAIFYFVLAVPSKRDVEQIDKNITNLSAKIDRHIENRDLHR